MSEGSVPEQAIDGSVQHERDSDPRAPASMATTLEAFSRIVEDLAADDDMFEFRRLLAAEAHHA